MRPRRTLSPRRVTAQSADSNTLVHRNAARARGMQRSHTQKRYTSHTAHCSQYSQYSQSVQSTSIVSTVTQYSQLQSEHVAQYGLDTPLHVELLRESLFSSLPIMGNLPALCAEATAAPTVIYSVRYLAPGIYCGVYWCILYMYRQIIALCGQIIPYRKRYLQKPTQGTWSEWHRLVCKVAPMTSCCSTTYTAHGKLTSFSGLSTKRPPTKVCLVPEHVHLHTDLYYTRF